MFDAAEIKRAAFVAVEASTRLALLNRQLAFAAAHSPFYRETLAGLHPLTALSALETLPLLSAETLGAQGRRLVCVPASEIARIVSLPTSGTSGSVKRLYFSRGDLDRTAAFFSEGMSWMCGPGDRVAVLMPCAAPNSVGALLCRGLTDLGALPLPMGVPEHYYAAAQLLLREQPAVLVGAPWQLRLLALLCPALRPRAVLLSADYVPESLPPLLRRQWNCAALVHYGLTETGYGCAVEHPAGGGMFLRQDALIAEIIDPVSGSVLPGGARGELVLTTLCREAMPLIRYRTGDMVSLPAEGRLGRVLGRRGADPTFYELQDRLCALPWLYDYRWEGAWLLTAVSADGAPPDAAARLTALAGGCGVKLVKTPPAEAKLFFPGKRPLPAAAAAATPVERL